MPEIPLLGIYPEKNIIQKKHEPQCSLQHYLQYPGHVLCAVLNHFSHVWLFATLWTIAHQAPLRWGFSRQEQWSGLPCPPPGDLPNPGIEPYVSCIGRWVGSLPLVPPRKPSQDMEVTQMSINRRMHNQDVAHIYNGISLSHKEEQNWFIFRDHRWNLGSPARTWKWPKCP